MKALVYTEYGSHEVLHVAEVEKPTPKENEVLVKVHAASINAGDWLSLGGKPYIVRLFIGAPFKPKTPILGGDLSGEVESVGSSVTEFKPGDEVIADIADVGRGGCAEYVAAPEHLVVLKPANVSFEDAAAVPIAGGTALQGLRDVAQVQPGQKVLVQGASGGVGTFAVQLAKYYGAEVTAVCSTRNLEMARSIGADHVIDYTQEDFTQNGQQYDVIFAANGYHTLAEYKRCLTPEGKYVCAGGKMPQIFECMLFGSLMSMGSGKQMSLVSMKASKQDLGVLAQLLESGDIKPVIDGCYPLSEAADAFRYVLETHAQGKVVITVEQDN